MDPLGEDQRLAPFGPVGLDDAHPGERLGQAAGEGVRGVAPEVFLVVLAVYIFLESKRLGWLGGGAVGFAHQYVRDRQSDISRIFRITEASPFHVFRPVENLRNISNLGHFTKCVPAE